MIDYDPHHWRSHLLDIKGSMVRQIFYRVLICVVWSALVTAGHVWWGPLNIPDRAHVLIGVALGLLLVFRTNSSNDRYWEGRKMWGGIINESRNLARSAAVWLADAPDLLHKLLSWTTLFPWATLHRLRGTPVQFPTVPWLSPEELLTVQKANHVPLTVARRMTEQLDAARRRGLLSDYAFGLLDQNVQLLVDYLGACERIHRTPLPFAYVVHLRRALIVYCLTLPFALVEPFGWWSVVVTLFLTYILIGIEEIGVEIEDPFAGDDNDLPLERFCDTVGADLSEIAASLALPDK
jgi:putative membrane protein